MFGTQLREDFLKFTRNTLLKFSKFLYVRELFLQVPQSMCLYISLAFKKNKH